MPDPVDTQAGQYQDQDQDEDQNRPESSSAALERYLLSQLEGLSISIPSDDVSVCPPLFSARMYSTSRGIAQLLPE